MIDTVALLLPRGNFKIHNPSRFHPSANTVLTDNFDYFGSQPVVKCTLNPTKADYQGNKYPPKLTLQRRPRTKIDDGLTLKIEVSLPKLVYRNNFDELENTDFDLVVNTLFRNLQEVGVEVQYSELENASVCMIHYGKNVMLTDYSFPSIYTNALNRIDITKRLDVEEVKYRNGGQVWKCHANSFEFIAYDKLADLNKAKISEKRTVEKDNYTQLNLFDHMNSTDVQVLRIEVRLNCKRKIKLILKKVHAPEDLSFKYLFCKELARKVCLHFIDDFISCSIPVLQQKTAVNDTFITNLLAENTKLSLNSFLKTIGMCSLINLYGLPGTRQILGRFGMSAWYAAKRNIKTTHVEKHEDPLSKLRNIIDQFDTVKLVDLNGKMINNDKYRIRHNYEYDA